jgi:hypothetical protein
VDEATPALKTLLPAVDRKSDGATLLAAPRLKVLPVGVAGVYRPISDSDPRRFVGTGAPALIVSKFLLPPTLLLCELEGFRIGFGGLFAPMGVLLETPTSDPLGFFDFSPIALGSLVALVLNPLPASDPFWYAVVSLTPASEAVLFLPKTALNGLKKILLTALPASLIGVAGGFERFDFDESVESGGSVLGGGGGGGGTC